jgi:hypothetical protein
VLNAVKTLATQPPTTASSTNAHVCKNRQQVLLSLGMRGY